MKYSGPSCHYHYCDNWITKDQVTIIIIVDNWSTQDQVTSIIIVINEVIRTKLSLTLLWYLKYSGTSYHHHHCDNWSNQDQVTIIITLIIEVLRTKLSSSLLDWFQISTGIGLFESGEAGPFISKVLCVSSSIMCSCKGLVIYTKNIHIILILMFHNGQNYAFNEMCP